MITRYVSRQGSWGSGALLISSEQLIATMLTPGRRFDGVDFVEGRGAAQPYLPPFTQVSFEIPEAMLTRAATIDAPDAVAPREWDAARFEHFAKKAHGQLLLHPDMRLASVEQGSPQWPSLTVTALVAAIAKAALQADSLPAPAGAVARQQLRAGLQISRVRIVADKQSDVLRQIGRASCRERVCSTV